MRKMIAELKKGKYHLCSRVITYKYFNTHDFENAYDFQIW